MRLGGVVRNDVRCICLNCNWGREDRLLPARSRLVRELNSAEQCPTRRPEMPNVCSPVPVPFIKPDSRDRTSHVRSELQTDFNRIAVGIRNRARNCTRAPN